MHDSGKRKYENDRLNKLKSTLVEQGYPKGILDQGIEKAKRIPVEDLPLENKPKTENVL